MKLNIYKKDLLDPLIKVFGVIERRQTLPILSNVYFSVENDLLKLAGTDLEVQVAVETKINGEDNFKTAIPGRKLLDICRSLPEDTQMLLEFSDDEVIIKAGKGRFKLKTLSAEEYPLFDELNYVNEISLDRDILSKALAKTVFCMAQQDVRYYLNGLMMEIVDGELQTVASDGHRLALSKNQLDGDTKPIGQVIIPRKAAHEVLRLLDKASGTVGLKFAKNNIKFTIDDVQLNTKTINGRFPDYKNIVPDASKHNFNINKQEFKSAISRVSILSNEKYKGIRLDLSNQLMTINANNPEQDEAKETVVVDYQGEEISIGFNSSYLLDALSAIESDSVQVSFTDTNSSCLLETPNDSSTQFILMPMRI